MTRATSPGQPTPDAPGGCGPAPMAGRGPRPPRLLVFEHVRAEGRAARADVARALGISAASVTALTADLIAQGLLREVEGAREAARGRPPVALGVVGEARRVVGVGVGEGRLDAVLMDLAGATLAEATRDAGARRRTLEALVEEVAGLVSGLVGGLGGAAAVGVAVPGLVDHAAGCVAWSPVLQGADLPLRAALEARLGVPVHLDADGPALALAERWFGAGRTLPDLAVVSVGASVGLGLVRGGEAVRGARGLSPALGHVAVRPDGALCRCGRRGCLEAYVADHALAREAATVLDRDPGEGLLDALLAAEEGGDEAARAVFARAGRVLALGLDHVVQLLDPPLIVLAGGRALDALCEGGALDGLAAPTPGRLVRGLGEGALARGAAALALGAVTEALLGGA